MTNARNAGMICLVVPPALVILAIFFTVAQSVLLALAEASNDGAVYETLAKGSSIGLAILTPIVVPALVFGLPTGLYLVIRKQSGQDNGRGWRVAAVVFAVGFILFVCALLALVFITGGA